MFIIAATGGFEEPSFMAKSSHRDAERIFDQWSEDLLGQPGDRVDLLLVNHLDKITVLKTVSYGEDD